MPANRGSVGRLMSNGRPLTISCNGTERGTRKTVPNKSLSKEKRDNNNTSNANGSRTKRKDSSATKKALIAIKMNEIKYTQKFFFKCKIKSISKQRLLFT